MRANRSLSRIVSRSAPDSRPDRRLDPRIDCGQAAVLVVTIAAVLLVVLAVGLAAMGRTAADRTRAQTAADAAALASVEGDRAAAVEMAITHGATVVSWSTGPGAYEVTVTVAVGDVTATARATTAP